MRTLLPCLLALLLAACATAPGDPVAPIPVELVPAPAAGAARDLVILLPGRGDDVADLRASGMAAAIQAGMPDADVLLAGVTSGYCNGGRMPQRLHDEVVVPARARGYRHVWLAGASMGGLGTVLYEQAYPGEMAGLVMFAPFLGDAPLIDEIEGAGGLSKWNPGPQRPVGQDTYQREVWRVFKGWSEPGATRARQAWVAYGDADEMRRQLPPLLAILPEDHVFERPGGHAWAVWVPAARDVAAAIARER